MLSDLAGGSGGGGGGGLFAQYMGMLSVYKNARAQLERQQMAGLSLAAAVR